MQDLLIHKLRELPANAKEVLETLLGRHLADDEEVSIWASRPHSAPRDEARASAWRRLDEHLDRMASKTIGSTSELEILIDEESDRLRHGRE
jgi:hypothetical protein